ncbi:hypothetical protein OU5_P0322 (plasmid) [Pseudomonas mandelii JR-1]|uniref:GIY-YIG nuclease family protein n=2 Tax=Pseudomonas TaxID=286 RepID=A0ABR6TCS5_9PSED|nr:MULTISPECIES: GIY-YIG nuclease family protein [Pseudomonas]AHZ73574.1 hypothetical protein OU5_P0322 [Pseudomonas mandelii JR-1]MBC2383766.1 GIY-YIG nuclease family protein [Pseudomonas cremoris]MDY7069626.1 hypothetical protein [Pseudomonas extremaustralis]
MPDYYYQIKARKTSEYDGESEWAFPPAFSGLVTAADRKKAKEIIEEEYGREFPVRVLKKDLDEHHYLLRISEIDPSDEYILRRFRETQCKECGAKFRPIDKYNDPYSDNSGADYCTARCATAGKARDIRDLKLVVEGKVPAVIYQVRQISTGRVYVGQTTQPFTLRWWQHVTYPGESKFHEIIKSTPITDFDFSVIEVIVFPENCTDAVRYITDRERFWIEEKNAVTLGFNTVRPTGISPQQILSLDTI